jgi:hypothetical protein
MLVFGLARLNLFNFSMVSLKTRCLTNTASLEELPVLPYGKVCYPTSNRITISHFCA